MNILISATKCKEVNLNTSEEKIYFHSILFYYRYLKKYKYALIDENVFRIFYFLF